MRITKKAIQSIKRLFKKKRKLRADEIIDRTVWEQFDKLSADRADIMNKIHIKHPNYEDLSNTIIHYHYKENQ